MHYTLQELKQKTLKELKEIGYQLNVLPEGDRRLRHNWIDSIAGVCLPLLQLLEVSPGVEPVQEAIEVQRQEPIEVQRQEPIVQAVENTPVTPAFQVGDLVQSKTMVWGLERKSMTGTVLELLPRGGVRVQFGDRISGYGGSFDFSKSEREDLMRVQEATLKTVEDSPGVEPVQEAIEIQRQEPIETPPGVESKFGRIVYPKPIAPAINGTIPNVEPRPESADFHNSCTPAAEPNGDSSSNETASLGSQKGDRVLAVAGNSQRDKGRALLDRPNQLTASFNDEQPPNRGDGKGGRLENEPKLSQSAIGFCASPVTFSPKFLATYPPYFGEVHYKAEATGQLNLLEPETDDEPPDPDDFESLDAFNQAMARWDEENPEPLTVSMDSMCEWAPCPWEWYEPEAENLPAKASSMNQVMEVSPAPKSSITSDFSIPTFDAWCDRSNRQIDTDEPPDTGIFARRLKPKPPGFPPMNVVKGDRANSIRKFARRATLLSGRAPPGGDAMK